MTAAAPPVSDAHSGRRGFALADIGGLPLACSLPFMFFPKVLAGDTQPWVLASALIALATFRVQRFVFLRDGPLLALAALCIPAFALRSESGADTFRAAYTYLSFAIFWLVCRRESGEFFAAAVKATILVWFLVGVYQYVFISLGLPVAMAGRFVEGRSGVPSLTSEPATYGSLSLLQIMYLLGLRSARNSFFIFCAAVSIVLSGSLLAFALLVFPLFKLPGQLRLPVVAGVLGLVAIDYSLSASGITSRVLGINQGLAGVASLLADPSLNLRLGHLYFTMYENLLSSLLLTDRLSFMNQYNAFAQGSGIFIDTGSNYILPAVGDVIYGSGGLGALLIVLFLKASLQNCKTRSAKLQKTAFMLACMVNPISISNFFLILYAQQKE